MALRTKWQGEVVAEGAIFFWCLASVGLVRYLVGRFTRAGSYEPRRPGGPFDWGLPFRYQRMNLVVGLGASAIAIVLTVAALA